MSFLITSNSILNMCESECLCIILNIPFPSVFQVTIDVSSPEAGVLEKVDHFSPFDFQFFL